MKSYIKNKDINVSQFERKASEIMSTKLQKKTQSLTNRNFWKIIRPFLTNKGHLENAEIMLIQDKKVISNKNKLVKDFSKHYINIVETSGGQKPTNTAQCHTIDNNKLTVKLIYNSCRNHPNILKIKSNYNKGKGSINNN